MTKIVKTQNKKGLVLAALAASTVAAMADAGNDSFGSLFNTFADWMEGNLGKILSLLGFAGTFIVYMMTHKGGVLFIGIVISLIAGGMVGISDAFFTAGKDAFGTTE